MDGLGMSTTVCTAQASVKLTREHGRAVVWLLGEHDLSNTTAVAEALDPAGVTGDLVVDLSRVTFMGASTVGLLQRAVRSAALVHRTVELRRPSPSTRRIFDLCGCSKLLEPPSDALPGVTVEGQALRSWVQVPPSGPSGRTSNERGSVGREGT